MKKQEIERRIKRGRKVRFAMEEKGIRIPELMKKFRISRASIWLALRAGKMPTLLGTIEKFVGAYEPKVQ